jgi:hypothetical protein
MNQDYLAYMLRLRRSPDRSHWRATLENAHTGNVRHFANEEECFLFLMDRLTAQGPDADMQLDAPSL